MTDASDAPRPTLSGGIEAGGTRFICVIADSRGYHKARIDIPTTTPAETIAAVEDFFKTQAPPFGKLIALGIVSFGPLDLNWSSPTFGAITKTAREGWSQINLAAHFKASLGVLVEIETDVNGSAVGEFTEGAAVDCENFVYVTVGTGIGAGVFAGGKLMRGISHPEVGHMLVPRPPNDLGFAGICPFHGRCLEGLASGMAIQTRWQTHPKALSDDHPAWDLQAHYLALMCVNLTWMYAPEKIVFGGGVMVRQHLYPMIRIYLKQFLNGFAHDAALADMDRYLVPTALEGNAGIIGALSLARRVYFESRN